MKPIRLELKEFGPYKNEIIEWDKIINEPIFLITGKTGSGKSTLFDAITYALYNKTTGGKDIASLRTKTALDKDKTQVNFDFELSGKKYRIERTLAYLKAGNKNLTSGKVALMQYNDGKLEVLATKEQEVKEKVEELIGLDDKQFCQIIILPQGKFKEFLLSKSSEKKETLRSLFNTYFYQKFVEQLQEQAKKIDSSHKQKEKELITRFEQFDIEEELTKFEYLKDENFEEILGIINSQEETVKNEKKELLKLERSFSKEKEKFIELSKLNDKFTQLKNNKLELEELSKKEDYYSRLKLEVEKLKELQKSKDKIIEYASLLTKKMKLKKLEEALLNEEDKYKLDLDTNKKLALELNAQKTDIEELRKETIDYKFFYNNFNELILAKNNIEIYSKTLEELTLKKETYKELDSSLKVAKESYLEDIEEKNILDGSIGKLKLEVLKKEQDVEKLEEYNNKLSEVNDKSVKLTVDKKQLKELELEKKKLEQEVELLNKNKEQEILNDFLLKLHEGDDCPLCKQKIEHLPDIPDLAVVDESIEKSLQKVNKDIIQLETLIKKDEEEIGKISTLLKNLGDTINFKAKEELLQLEDELKAENIKLTDISKVIRTSEDKIKGLNREIEELSELFKNEDDIKQKHLEAKNKIEQFEKNVKVELDEFAGYYEKIQSQVEEFDNTYNVLQNNSNELLVRKTKLETEQKNNKTNLLEVSKRIENIVDSFTNSKLNKYYVTLEMAEEDIEKLNNLEDYESQINKFEDTKKIIVNSIEKLEEELKELNQPGLEEEQQKLQDIESQVNDFIEKVVILNTRLENNKKLYKKIHSEYIELLESSKEIREIVAFSDVVSGKTENRKSLETYVQGYYLDLILVAGTKRLLQMTNDRYRFIRRDEKSKGGGLQGLEIEIHDIYLNSTRIISSLSGGELFLASLALALGLAEVIQNESGGISLETIFIDEGFGSLDAETLDIALTTLIDLQSYGRNIGIISHVSELKERIRPKVEVYSKDNYAKIKMTGI
ncbi:AAA family ATPase [Gemella haemolysans]|uniref:Nuclease SbcCD subunit C n=1 Tax=Gemella haemolysans ATCC 10379 TaxID=546270 RepID=C5NXT7_9BACL|nr:SMC family ATPase [Gemella haemolysans]EER67964.1 putative baculovirus FP protein [Gemella haemolysans ATCC 10379]KAA8708860.1 SMC family ATPase [Gemella haemolysans]UBH82798.1 SMC family ATPase [Gemella haemolysans]VEI38939.1 Nuclease sbcCD subunit C [Gemella haemolysans]